MVIFDISVTVHHVVIVYHSSFRNMSVIVLRELSPVYRKAFMD